MGSWGRTDNPQDWSEKRDSFYNHKLMRPRETKLVNNFVIFRS